jgi:hypothetical protein
MRHPQGYIRRLITPALAVLLLTLVHAPAMSQDFTVDGTVDRTTTTLGQALVYTLSISGSANVQGTPQLPVLTDFTVLGGTSSSTNIQIINGKMTRTSSFSYTLMPQKSGKLTIPAITLKLNNESYSTEAIGITVSDAPQAQAPGQAPQQGPGTGQSIENLIFIRAEIDNNGVWQNQGITVSYKLYTALDVSQYSVEQMPTEGFWSEEYPLPPQPALVPEIINGMRFQAAVIKRLELFPTHPGELTLAPMHMIATVRIPTRRTTRNVFDRFFNDPFFGGGQRQKVNLATKPITIIVNPLPDDNKPAGFENVVGQFSLSASVDKKNVSTDDAITLSVVVEGTGNIKLVEPPDLNVSADFEVYDPKITEDIRRSGTEISGVKRYEYVLVPRNPGAQRIRSMKLNYFNPWSGKYETAETGEIVLTVTKGQNVSAALPSNLTREEIRLVGSDIRFIKVETPEWLPVGARFYHGFLFWSALGFPFLLIAGAMLLHRHTDRLQSDSAYRRRRSASAEVTKRLSEAESAKAAGELGRCYAEINVALYGYIADHLDVPVASLTPDSAVDALNAKSVETDIVEKFSQVLKTCEYARFAPASIQDEDTDAMLDDARTVLGSLEKKL